MTFFSDERATELRDLFFESAQELLQALNDEGLELERKPKDPEIVRDIRRTVHTLKGDSAACGFKELSELAHAIEDALTPNVVQNGNGALVELVLHAADTFDSMLTAYRTNGAQPNADHVRALIRRLTEQPKARGEGELQIEFVWTEYEQLLISKAAEKGIPLYNLAIEVDAQCPMRIAALQLVKNVLQHLGALVVVRPEGDFLPEHVATICAVIASSQPADAIEKKIQVPSISRRTVLESYVREGESRDNIVRRATSLAVKAVAAPAPVAPAPTVEPPKAEAPKNAVDHSLPALMPIEDGDDERTEAAAPSSLSISPENLLRVDAERIDAVLNLVGELIINKSMLNQTLSDFGKQHAKDPLRAKFADGMAFQAQILNELQRSVMKIRMVPVEQLFRRFPRVVRDVARANGKQCELIISGQNTDLDKSILDALAEPMMHLVRNAVDHGIEMPNERTAAGKPAKGTLKLNAYYQGNQVLIELSDDGAGIDRDRVVARAIANNILSEKEADKLSEQEALSLIFQPGLSTAEQVTEISGRGMGMDIVQSVLKRLKGSIGIQTERGKGTTFQLRVPLTLAIMQALLFRVAKRLYAVPLGSVVEIARTTQSHIHTVDHHEVLQLRDQIITLVRLDALEGRKRAAATGKEKIFVIVVSLGDRRFGLVVDKLEGEEELVIKALEDSLVATELVSGASILGDGTVVLILNVASVVERLGRAAVGGGARKLGASA
ncbi:MAG TPA: chemotaxis protein CheA [Candidatus Koribacter sp.]